MGNAGELRKAADDIETITQASVEAYKKVATISEDEIKALMNAETWILPQDAVNYGFATEIDDDDDDDEPKQSAFGVIMRKLTAPGSGPGSPGDRGQHRRRQARERALRSADERNRNTRTAQNRMGCIF